MRNFSDGKMKMVSSSRFKNNFNCDNDLIFKMLSLLIPRKQFELTCLKPRSFQHLTAANPDLL